MYQRIKKFLKLYMKKISKIADKFRMSLYYLKGPALPGRLSLDCEKRFWQISCSFKFLKNHSRYLRTVLSNPFLGSFPKSEIFFEKTFKNKERRTYRNSVLRHS